MMNTIYSQCAQCNIWLGELGTLAAEDVQAAFDTIAWIAMKQNEPTQVIKDMDRDQRRTAGRAIKTMMNLPWWGRIWTLQEVLLPRKAVVYWGSKELEWKKLLDAGQGLLEMWRSEQADFDVDGCLNNVASILNGMRYTMRQHMLLVFWRWRYRNATDARDKIYGLMGLRNSFRECLGQNRACDYTLDVVSLYTTVTTYLINQNGNLEPIMGLRDHRSAIKGLPSWVVDWTNSGSMMFFSHYSASVRRGYTADRGLLGLEKGIRLVDPQTLILEGLYVDQVAVVGDRNAEKKGLIEKYQQWLSDHERNPDVQDHWNVTLSGIGRGNFVPDGDDYKELLEGWYSDFLPGQAIFVTERGNFGLGPTTLLPGQQLRVVGGSKFPVILEQLHDQTIESEEECTDKDFRWVADCLVYGMMKGEALKETKSAAIDIRIH